MKGSGQLPLEKGIKKRYKHIVQVEINVWLLNISLVHTMHPLVQFKILLVGHGML